MHLVPFGEYTPLTDYFPFLKDMSVATGDFSAGPAHRPIAADAGKIGVLICFEGVFPDITNETVRNGPRCSSISPTTPGTTAPQPRFSTLRSMS